MTALAETDASTAACRNAWPWACPETVRPSAQPPGLQSPEGQPDLLCQTGLRTPFGGSVPPSGRPLSLPLFTEAVGRLPSSKVFTDPSFRLCYNNPPFPKVPDSSFAPSSGWSFLTRLPCDPDPIRIPHLSLLPQGSSSSSVSLRSAPFPAWARGRWLRMGPQLA